jgi:riboflavin kinase/FMN adenylyltransferase
MEIVRGLDAYPSDSPPSVVALGAFDGIHLAHQKILATAVERSRALGVRAVACTFDPHPLTILEPSRAPAPITDLAENLALIAAQGVDTTVVIPFSLDFSRIEPERFVGEVLGGRLKARAVVVGFNHRFGRSARGDAQLLERLAPDYGFAVHVIPPVLVEGTVVSSTAIRQALGAGDVARARSLLGHPYTVRGRVLRGKGRGRQLGFPTANLRPERKLVLAPGVYAARASWDGGSAGAVVNVGVRPTFGEGEYWVEAYLLDFSGDLYDTVLTLAFQERIRPERKFPDVEALNSQVAHDVATAGRMLGERSRG